jgi:hypothetical protein
MVVKREPINPKGEVAARRESERVVVPMNAGQHNLREESTLTLLTGINGGKSE